MLRKFSAGDPPLPFLQGVNAGRAPDYYVVLEKFDLCCAERGGYFVGERGHNTGGGKVPGVVPKVRAHMDLREIYGVRLVGQGH